MIKRLLLILFFSLFTCSAMAAADFPQEYRVKANYLLNMPIFVTYPASAGRCSTFVIGLIGNTPLDEVLETSRGKIIKGRPLEVRRIRSLDQLGCCQVLFIASSERYRLASLLAEANRRGILTISDMRDFSRQGGMVQLVTLNNRITFDLNQGAARKAAISFGTQLLKLANDIRN